MFKKGQAAMEFLMTYGWAILVVMAAIGALAYFGVLDTAGFLPAKCSFPAGLDCIGEAAINSDATAGTIMFVVQNSKGESINVTAGTITSDDCTGTFLFASGIGATPTADYMELSNNEKGTVMVTCGAVADGRFKAEIVLDYTQSSTGLALNAAGSIRGKAS
ncbi:MAG: hypothetical protein ABIB43_03615 [archaeon]